MNATSGDRPAHLADADELDDFVASNDRALVEFHTDGCTMCDAMQPVLGNVARASDVAVGTMNPRDDPVLVEAYDVRSVPKLLAFEGGELAETMEAGFVPTADVLEFVAEAERPR